MFTNLKNKLIEEVKASPSKFQQFATAAQAAVSSNASTSDSNATPANFFSITEEDTPQNSPYRPIKLPSGGRSTTPQSLSNGTGTRTRRLSNSSMASDVSFRWPSFEPSATPYHLQSDLEASGSEMDDSVSTAKLDVVSKEQLYNAYRKSLDRYQKYRYRYTDLAKRFKDLERDSTKARSVLVETQEKAIRRVNELREQCSLEQQAKAHLEESLRMEMDDMHCKMQAYQTKLKLLGENPDNITTSAITANLSESLIDLDSNAKTQETKSKSEDFDITVTKIEQLEKQLQERDLLVTALNEKIANSTMTIEKLQKQEEENAIHLAQTKQAIYTELEHKESEVKKLQESNKLLQQTAAKKETQHSVQLNELKEKLKNSLMSKQEGDAKLISLEHLLSELKVQFADQKKEFNTAEQRISTMAKENEQKLNELRKQNTQLSEMLQRNQNTEISFAEIDNELNRTKNENDILRTTIAEHERNMEKMQKELSAANKDNVALNAEKTNLEEALANERTAAQKQMEKLNKLETEIQILIEQNTNNENAIIASLKSELIKTNSEFVEQLNELKDKLIAKEKELKATTNKMTKQKKQHDTQHQKILEQSEEIEQLKNELNKHDQHLQTLQSEATVQELEKSELRAQINNILNEISQMEEQMRVVQQSHEALETEKRSLEINCESLQRQTVDTNENVGQQIKSLLSENAQLKENSMRLEKMLAERNDQERVLDEANVIEMRLKLETTEDANEKLTQKLSQVLDENSRMHNAQELMDHDFRTLQDKYDALEKEKLLAQDAQKCVEAELTQLRSNQTTSENNIKKVLLQLEQRQQQLDEMALVNETLTNQLSDLQNMREKLEHETQALSVRLNEMKATQSDDDKLSNLLQENQQRIIGLQCELEAKESKNKLQAKESERQLVLHTQKLNEMEQLNLLYEQQKDELELLRVDKEGTTQELSKIKEELQTKSHICSEVQLELDTLRNQLNMLTQEKEHLNKKLEEHKTLLNDNHADKSKLQTELATFKEQKDEELVSAQQDMVKLKETEEDLRAQLAESEENHKTKITSLNAKIATANDDVQKLRESNDALQMALKDLESNYQLEMVALNSNVTQLQTEQKQLKLQAKTTAGNADKLANYEQFQLENEYLQKQVEQLESTLSSEKQETIATLKENDELKSKLKSLQCELYVLTENSEKHSMHMSEKQDEISRAQAELDSITETLTNERHEQALQTEHTRFITQKNDSIQRELLNAEQHIAELEKQLKSTTNELERLKQKATEEATLKDQQIASLTAEAEQKRQNIETVDKETSEVIANSEAKSQLQTEELKEKFSNAQVESDELVTKTLATAATSMQNDATYLRTINAALQSELEALKYKSETEISNLQEELEDLHSNSKHMTERISELESLRAGLQAQQLLAEPLSSGSQALHESNIEINDGKDEMEEKLKTIMSEVQDVSNRNLFLEQQCENYLILEQSNERLKLQNSKLSRQLDETLVSMQHNEGVSANTEFEYLKNIMFQYLTGTASGNNETFVKVISAVLKFSPQQTQVALEKEHQRRSLLNKIL